MKSALLLLPLLLASCGEPVRDDHFTNNGSQADAATSNVAAPVASAMAVRVGELGPNFEACAAAGTTRHLPAGAGLPMRAAPFQDAAETGSIPAATQFFICSRSLDQKWLGVVAHQSGRLDAACGVSDPLPARRPYDGPCRSGWVSSAFVQQIAGIETPTAPAATQAAGAGAAR